MKNSRKVILQYSITTGVAGAITVLVLSLRNFWDATTLVEKYRTLSDAFTIPGVLLIMVCALVWISTTGFFDGLSYAFTRAGGMLIPFFRKGREHMTYYDYKMSKKGKEVRGYSFLFFVGLLFIIISIVFISLFYSVYTPQ